MSKGKHVGTCRTCGSEIVELVNESHFGDGECDACENTRYKSQPDLMRAAYLALEEIEQWIEVMNGAEDPRTEEAVEALKDALDEAEEVYRKKSQ